MTMMTIAANKYTLWLGVQEMLPGGIARKIKPSFDGTTNSHDPAHITHPVTWWKSQGNFFPQGRRTSTHGLR